MGVSPKTFCKILQFQKSIECMTFLKQKKLIDVAMLLGYYDQASFVHDFKQYANLTPKQYIKLLQTKEYSKKVINKII